MKRRIGIFKKSLGIMSVLIGLVLVVGFASQAHATPTISVTKLCENAAGPGQRIVFYGVVTNTGPGQLDLVTVVDDQVGTVFGPTTLLPGESANYSGSYIPTSSPSTDTVTASGTYLGGWHL